MVAAISSVMLTWIGKTASKNIDVRKEEEATAS
jgi:hypothetical protein